MGDYKIDYEMLELAIDSIENILEELEDFKNGHQKIPDIIKPHLHGSTYDAIEIAVEEQIEALNDANDNLEEILESAKTYKEELQAELEEEFYGQVFLEAEAVRDLVKSYHELTEDDVKEIVDTLEVYMSQYENKVARFNDRVASINYSDYEAYEVTEIKQLIKEKSTQIDKYYQNKVLYDNMQSAITLFNTELAIARTLKQEIITSLDNIEDVEKEASDAIKSILKMTIKLSPFGYSLFTAKLVGKFEENHPWITEITHLGLTLAGMVPGIGWMCDSANAVLYACEGDWKNVAWSVASVVPGVAVAGYSTKGFKTIDGLGDFSKLMKGIEKGEDAEDIYKLSRTGNKTRHSAEVSDDAIKSVEGAMDTKKAADWALYLEQNEQNLQGFSEWISDEEARLQMSDEELARDIVFGTLNDFAAGGLAKGISML